jgi:small subunit ribosomal protein S21
VRRSTNSRSAIQPDGAVASIKSSEDSNRGADCGGDLRRVGAVMNLAEVRLQEGESIDNALRRFKRKVQTEDIIKEMKRHSFYLKPGAKRRVKQALARKRARKKIRKESD